MSLNCIRAFSFVVFVDSAGMLGGVLAYYFWKYTLKYVLWVFCIGE